MANDIPPFYPPESHDGNVEYKRMIVDANDHRLEHLLTQMKYRLDEGAGQAIYTLGVNDDGSIANITNQELQCSLENVRHLASRLGAKTQIKRRSLNVLEVSVFRDWSESVSRPEVRVAVIGKSYAGKSTLVGVLNGGQLDDGKGFARVSMLSHYHELDSGMTSTTSAVIIGFDPRDQIINVSPTTELFRQSARVVAIIDLPGNHRFVRTAMHGLTGNHPDVGLVVVSADESSGMTLEDHLWLLLALEMKIVLTLNKIDCLTSQQLGGKLKDMQNVVQKMGKTGFVVSNCEELEQAFFSDCVPILPISLSDGTNVEIVKRYLAHLRQKDPPGEQPMEDCELRVIKVFMNRRNKLIVGGTLNRGVLKVGQKLFLGPFEGGHFHSIVVESLHRWKIPCTVLTAVKSRVSVAFIPSAEFIPRPGQVLVGECGRLVCGRMFLGRVVEIRGSPRIKSGDITTVYMEGIRQAALVGDSPQAGDVFLFTFCNYDEAFRFGVTFILLDDQHIAYGVVLGSGI